ncbi:CD180 antigen [Amia ocellicauda]|uniref:CD180 antigen n=1 Tax=Amia ocellicauda TaxID=2972642 RepID=UPI003463FA94
MKHKWLFVVTFCQWIHLIHTIPFSGMTCAQIVPGLEYDCSGHESPHIPQDLPLSTQSLDFSFNYLPYVYNSTFVNLKSLVHLDLTRCRVSWVFEDAFQFQLDLQRLVLTGNPLVFIADKAFLGPHQLKHLHLAQTTLTSLKLIPTENLNWLETLDFGDNNIFSLEFLGMYTLRNLKTLDFQINDIQNISADHVSHLKYTRGLNLNLRGNDIQYIEPNAFNSFQLNSLDLSGCFDEVDISVALTGLSGLSTQVLNLGTYETSHGLPWISAQSLQGLCNITVKELSFQLQHFQDLSNETFKCLTGVEKLDLTRAHISYIPSHTEGMKSLTHLVLSENYFLDICSISPQNFPDLTSLFLRGNIAKDGLRFQNPCLQVLTKLTYLDVSHSGILTGAQCCSRQLEGLASLHHLNMSYNNQIKLEDLPFIQTPQLRLLDLSHVKMIYNSSQGPFRNLHTLQTLNLSGAYTNISDTNLLAGLRDLRVLSLHDNSFYSGVVSDSGMFKHVPALEVLILSKCHITAIADEVFQPLARLRQVDFRKNQLVTFNGNAFHSLKNIQLNFAVNLIETIALSSVTGIEGSSQIDLSANPLLCNCSNVDFISWYGHNLDKIANAEETLCGPPLENTKLRAVHLNCSNQTVFTVFAVLLGVAIFITTSVLTVKSCRKCKNETSVSYRILDTYEELQ